jgi:hypothetical protein
MSLNIWRFLTDQLNGGSTECCQCGHERGSHRHLRFGAQCRCAHYRVERGLKLPASVVRDVLGDGPVLVASRILLESHDGIHSRRLRLVSPSASDDSRR